MLLAPEEIGAMKGWGWIRDPSSPSTTAIRLQDGTEIATCAPWASESPLIVFFFHQQLQHCMKHHVHFFRICMQRSQHEHVLAA